MGVGGKVGGLESFASDGHSFLRVVVREREDVNVDATWIVLVRVLTSSAVIECVIFPAPNLFALILFVLSYVLLTLTSAPPAWPVNDLDSLRTRKAQ